MQLGLAATLSHHARLLLLDEPTSGLDPVMRDEMLNILREYMAQGNRTLFFSTHITADLEKIADYIVYIHKGKIIYAGSKSELLTREATFQSLEDIMVHVNKTGTLRANEVQHG